VSILAAWVIQVIYDQFKSTPEVAVMIIGLAAAGAILIPIVIYFIWKKRAIKPSTIVVIVLTATVIMLVSIYFFYISYEIKFPADILIWSESDFVNDILKLRIGYPLYTTQLSNESFVYPPLTQMITYFLAGIIGKPSSIPVYRSIQLVFVATASILSAVCVQILVRGSGLEKPRRSWKIRWYLIVPVMFLFATNSITNPYIHNLHNDSLAQLVSVMAFLLLLAYTFRPTKGLLIGMAILPTLGFFVKQNLIIWAFFYCAYLIFFDRSKSLKKILVFSVVTFGLFGLAYLVAYQLYGENFYYWVITVLGKHGISPLRSFQHLLDVWLFLAIGVIAGLVLLRGKNFKILIGPWLIWLAFISIEIYTSGVAWMINHIGPGSLLAGILFIAAVQVGFSRLNPGVVNLPRIENWFRSLAVLTILLLLMSGLGFIRVPVQSVSNDAYRYIEQIEFEFSDQPTETILLDAGTWVYLDDGVVMKDRAPSIGERGYSQTGDFSALLQRIEQRQYSKIILRNFHNPDFWYDHFLWEYSSGIRAALTENYREVRRIPAVADQGNYLFAEISVLEPIDE
jgi:hypothetical protein